jgi:cytochrome b subunit of formate dehydrogenase
MARRAGNESAPSCVSCHGSHDVMPADDPASRTYPANVPAQCGTCHTPALRSYQKGVHGVELARANDPAAATCTSCHTAHGVARTALPWSTVAPGRVATTCAACHLEAGIQYAPSVHARAAARGAPHAGTCVDCHGSHDIPRAAAPTSPTSVLQVASATCARCHEPVELTEMHGLEAGVVADFRGSFHGLALAAGDSRVANCASCHGYHEVRPSWDPLSRINPANLVATCGQCHAGAGLQFARGGIHHLPRTFGHRLVEVVRVMYRMTVLGIIGLMLLHNLLDFRRRLRDRRAARRAPRTSAEPGETRTYQRFTRGERVQHWLLAGSFITLAVTGFALTEGWSVPGVSAQTGAILRSAVHRGAAVLFIGLAVYHLGYLAFTVRGRQFLRAMVPRLRSTADAVCCAASCFRLGPPSTSDWRSLVQTVQYNIGLARERPRQGRFTYAEKMEYFALIWGGIVMIGSGLALWFEVPFLNRFPFWSFQLATTVHLYEALLATLAIVVWHFYFTMLNPDVFPISKAMITGQVTREEMEREHPDELREVEERERADPDQARVTGSVGDNAR